MRFPALIVALSTLVVCGTLHADSKAELEARALFKEGNRLFAEKEYAAALDMYKAAYDRWPNPKIFLNIGTTLRHLGRDAEAADAYEKYLIEGKPDSKRKAEVEKILKDISARLGRLKIQVNEPGARVLVDGKVVGESPQAITLRVDPGTHTIVADKQGYPPAAATVQIAAGQEREVALRLIQPGSGAVSSQGALPPHAGSAGQGLDQRGKVRQDAPGLGGGTPPPKAPREAGQPALPLAEKRPGAPADVPPPASREEPAALAHRDVTRTVPRHPRLLAFARVDADGKFRGAAGTLGVGYAPLRWLDLWAAGILGPTFGFETGATVFFLKGSLSPLVLLGCPVFFSDGPRPGIHGALGVEWRMTRSMSAFLLAGVEVFPTAQTTPEVKYEKVVFVPSLGLTGRM